MKIIIKRLCIYSEHIINYTFYLYFFVYVVGELFKKSIVYNYLFIILIGLFLGYRIATSSRYYLDRNKE